MPTRRTSGWWGARRRCGGSANWCARPAPPTRPSWSRAKAARARSWWRAPCTKPARGRKSPSRPSTAPTRTATPSTPRSSGPCGAPTPAPPPLPETSPRTEKPFLAINRAQAHRGLFAAELFGYVRGAFAGATQGRPGLFREADGGTLFLDEVGELPLEAQAKLLRVMETGTVRPVGGVREEPVNVRVIAATNRNLAEAAREGKFREDLLYRLHVLSIEIPPLRERREDIAPIALALLRR